MRKFHILLACFAVSLLIAQAPELMSYQSVIRNSSNNLVTNQIVSVKLSVLKNSASGAVVYEEIHNPSTNSNGLLTIQIGAGAVVSGNVSTIDWSTDKYFIKTEIDPNGGSSYTITGVSQLLSVPYALYAKTSGSSLPGPQGLPGTDGTDGTNGFSLLQGTSAPAPEIGVNGDTYINVSNGDVYTKTSGTWSATGNIKGATGPAGANGTNGTNGFSLLQGTSAPGAIGVNGDTYINVSNGDVYAKTSGTWNVTGNIKGAAGTNGTNGQDGTGFSNGTAAGQVYLTGSASPYSPQSPVTMSGNVTINSAGNTTIANDAVDTGKIANEAVTEAKLDTNAVTTTKIADGNVTNAKLANSSVTISKISTTSGTAGSTTYLRGDGTWNVPATTIADGSITSAKIADGTITNADINNTAGIAYSKLSLANSIQTGDIVNGAVTTAKISATGTAGNTTYLRGDGSWSTPITGNVSRNSTLSGDGTSGSPLGINLGNANTWTANQTFAGTFLITSNSRIAMTNSDNKSKEFRMQEPSGSGSQYVGFTVPPLTDNIVYQMPAAIGSVGQVLSVASVGTSLDIGAAPMNALQWVTPSSSGNLSTVTISANGTTLTTANQFVYITGVFTVTLPSSPTVGQQIYIYSESTTASVNPNGKQFRYTGANYGTSTYAQLGGDTSKGTMIVWNGTYWFIF